MMGIEQRSNQIGYRSSMSGFTLMEVLIAIVIFSIGLLGVAGLQLNSLRGNQLALESSIAASLAREGAERVRANLAAVRNTKGDNEFLSTQVYKSIVSAGSDPGCITTGCKTPELIALTDAYEWITAIQEQLPGGVGVICLDETPSDGVGGSATTPWDPECTAGSSETFAVKVAWDHDKDDSTPFVVYRLSFQP
jgi:type IV pilus assembly protein PilV